MLGHDYVLHEIVRQRHEEYLAEVRADRAFDLVMARRIAAFKVWADRTLGLWMSLRPGTRTTAAPTERRERIANKPATLTALER